MVLIPVAVIALIFLLSRLTGGSSYSESDIVRDTSVLVWGPSGGVMEDDAKVYSIFYRRVDVVTAEEQGSPLAAIEGKGYDIVHLCCEVDGNGELVGGGGVKVGGGDLLEACHGADVKLLILAASNPADNYMRAFDKKREPKGLRLNQVLTIDRKGEKFPAFLEGLFRRVSGGISIPTAWVELAPQHEGPAHDDLPGTVCLMGRGGVALLP
jgi:hypothetical protein